MILLGNVILEDRDQSPSYASSCSARTLLRVFCESASCLPAGHRSSETTQARSELNMTEGVIFQNLSGYHRRLAARSGLCLQSFMETNPGKNLKKICAGLPLFFDPNLQGSVSAKAALPTTATRPSTSHGFEYTETLEGRLQRNGTATAAGINEQTIIGIDPDNGGAVAVISVPQENIGVLEHLSQTDVEIHDMPLEEINVGKRIRRCVGASLNAQYYSACKHLQCQSV